MLAGILIFRLPGFRWDVNVAAVSLVGTSKEEDTWEHLVAADFRMHPGAQTQSVRPRLLALAHAQAGDACHTPALRSSRNLDLLVVVP